MKESDIRPEALLSRYLALCARDAERCFSDTARLDMCCVACGCVSVEHQFEKNGFSYVRCTNCGTLYQSPRPAIEAFEAFYRDSESSRFWAEEFFPAVAEARRERIFRPRVERMSGMCTQKGLQVDRLIDVGAGWGLFLDEWRRISPQVQSLAIEPSASLANECRSKGLSVVEDIVENVSGYDGYADLVTCFEVLEHVYDPLGFVQVLKRLARPGGYVFVSTLGIDGFDLQVLGKRSSQISPPHHINFLSVQGFTHLFERAGLMDVDVTTPGQLDVDIVRNAVRRDPSLLDGQEVLKRLVSEDVGDAFQRFIVEQKMSSHVWVFGRKREEERGG